MDIFYYKHKKGNFGDELNPFLWNTIFGEDKLSSSLIDSVLFGIGTILERGKLEEYSDRKVHVFGSGIRNVWDNFDNKNMHFHFVRGPISANVLGLSKDKAITDSAYCLKFIDKVNQPVEKKYKYSFMPHFSSMELINWKPVCDELGIHFISPEGDINFILEEIKSTEFMLAEAMHGAIVADYYRVPWVRVLGKAHFFESRLISELKWEDWTKSIGCNNVWNMEAKNFHSEAEGIKGSVIQSLNKMLLKNMFKKIIKSTDEFFQLSSDILIREKFDRLEEKISDFKKML